MGEVAGGTEAALGSGGTIMPAGRGGGGGAVRDGITGSMLW